MNVRHFIIPIIPRTFCLVLSVWGAMQIIALVQAADAATEPTKDKPADAQWIWGEKKRAADQTVYFRKTFRIPTGPLRAELAGVGDFCRMTMFVNGELVADVDPYRPPLEIDVAEHLKPGEENVLAVRATSVSGPSAIFLRLHITPNQGKRQTVVTDDTWLVTGNPPAGWHGRKFSPQGWRRAATFGEVAGQPWGATQRDHAITQLDDYTQWKQALGTDHSTDPSTFLVAPGFQIELLRSARKDEGSWVSLAVDPRGRIVIGREDQGLLRVSLPNGDGEKILVETINTTLKECRGLLFAHGSLYANANNSKGLYRLRDTTGDDRPDEVKLLYKSGGGVGHGRNTLALGPAGMIYSIHGDAVELPRGIADLTSPFREHRRGASSSEGHVVRISRDGRSPQLVAAGLRNPFGIDFNTDGEMFTYDADAEFDMGSPWYRPTRVDHVVPGGDFGWRGVTRQWPPYFPDHPDNALPNLDIGKGSPTAVKFGTRSRFPPLYRRALFILDWAYGRILVVHMTPRGASYAGRAETFVKGRPLNVTGLDFGPDGAMYVVTGGRKTQSGLYRIRYTGPPAADAPLTPQQRARVEHAAKARTLRRKLESLCSKQDPGAVDVAWPHLDSPDPWIRHAARVAIEHQPIARWRQRALYERRPTAALTAALALARGEAAASEKKILAKLNAMPPLAELSEQQLLIALETYSRCLAAAEQLDTGVKEKTVARLDAVYPHGSDSVNQYLSRLLVRLDAPSAVSKTLDLLARTDRQSQQLHYLFVLRRARRGWTDAGRRQYFLALGRMRDFQGGEGMPGFIGQIHQEALAALDDAQRAELAPLLARGELAPQDRPPASGTRPMVRAWKLVDLANSLAAVGRGRDFERGARMFAAASCASCHRMGRRGAAVGPDLTSVAGRFSSRDLLASILTPSKVVAQQYRNVQIVTTGGKVLVGRVVPSNDYRSEMLRIATDPRDAGQITEIAKRDIESSQTSPVSPMPEGLLNTLTKAEILDLLAYLESAGDQRHGNFGP